MVRWSIIALLLSAPVWGQSVSVSEKFKEGEYFHVEIKLNVSGKLQIERDGKPSPLAMEATAELAYFERIEHLGKSAEADKIVRFYTTAKSQSTVGTEKTRKELRNERRLTLSEPTESGLLHICPDGPFLRDELELIGEHFDTRILPSLLPNKNVQLNDNWSIPDKTIRQACQFDEISKHNASGTITKIDDAFVIFKIEGTAEGSELGAKAKIRVSAVGKYDRVASRVVQLEWEQTDAREQGPASPAAALATKLSLTRKPLAAEPRELAAEARVRVPKDRIPTSMTHLSHSDPDGRYALTYPREWVIVGRTGNHLVLRWLERGKFVAQMTVANWKKAEIGSHTPAAEFREAIGKIAGWKPTSVIEDGEVPIHPKRWLYKQSAKGTQDGAEVLQTFYLMAGPLGDQLAITVMSAPENAKRLADGETQLLKSIALPEKK